MLIVELLKTPTTKFYKIKDGDLLICLPYNSDTERAVLVARQKNLIRYLERIGTDADTVKLNSFMNGFYGLRQDMPIKQVLERISMHILKYGKPTPEKRRYSLIAMPLAGLKSFDIEDSRVPCIKISCTMRGLDIKTSAKYLRFKDGKMQLEDSEDIELVPIKGVFILIRPMNGSVIVAKE